MIPGCKWTYHSGTGFRSATSPPLAVGCLSWKGACRLARRARSTNGVEVRRSPGKHRSARSSGYQRRCCAPSARDSYYSFGSIDIKLFDFPLKMMIAIPHAHGAEASLAVKVNRIGPGGGGFEDDAGVPSGAYRTHQLVQDG